MLFTTNTEYIDYFNAAIEENGGAGVAIKEYLENQFNQLNKLIKKISKETFWEIFPEILGIDAKLTLLIDLIELDEHFPNDEIIRMVEDDYQGYFKELCGYNLNTEPKPSMIFNVI